MIGKFEPMFERTASNTAMQVAICRNFLLLAGDGQQVGAETYVEIVLCKARYRDRDAV
jgi:hypothetical protein